MIRLHFCPRCGTTVSLTFDRFPDVQAVTRGTFDDPNWVTINAHLFTRSAQAGVALPSDVDCYEQLRIRLDGTPNSPRRYAQPTMTKAVSEEAP